MLKRKAVAGEAVVVGIRKDTFCALLVCNLQPTLDQPFDLSVMVDPRLGIAVLDYDLCHTNKKRALDGHSPTNRASGPARVLGI